MALSRFHELQKDVFQFTLSARNTEHSHPGFHQMLDDRISLLCFGFKLEDDFVLIATDRLNEIHSQQNGISALAFELQLDLGMFLVAFAHGLQRTVGQQHAGVNDRDGIADLFYFV